MKKNFNGNKYKNNLEDVKCYKCEKIGHFSNNYPEKKKQTNYTHKKSEEKDTECNKLDVRKIRLNKRKIEAVFDTVASKSFITSGEQKNLEI
ncbi:hypothetical protein H311_04381 [Anncaliia algerae PRA109]|nr:hypothetical protein H311_04381 [Anncaliia algerae PRA109]